jgi:cob(I)alamin adenosyltransferase
VVAPRIYTKTGDDGTTGLSFGGRVSKDSLQIELNGVVDETQSAMGLARASTEEGSEVDLLLVSLCHDLYLLMAEVAVLPENRHKAVAAGSVVTPEMVVRLEEKIDELLGRFEMPRDFTIPGKNATSAALDYARTVARRAERLWVQGPIEGSLIGQYLNRLSDLLWAMARWQEGPDHQLSKRVKP